MAIPLATEGVNTLAAWKARVDASKAMIDKLKPEWDRNLERYLVKRATTAAKDEIIVPKDYANVEQKKALLFFQTPDVQLEPKMPGLEDAVTLFQAVLNYYLGPHGVNAHVMAREVLTDALCPSGIFATKIAYEPTINGTKQVQTGQQPDPNWQPPSPGEQQPGAILGLNQPTPQPPMVPQMATVPNVIAERYLWERISPAKLLLPDDFHGSDFDKASWLGQEFLMDFEPAKKLFGLGDDFKAFAGDDDRRIGKADGTTDTRTKQHKIRGYEIFYKASIFDPTEPNPDRMRLLVLIDGLDQPAKHDESPYQITLADGSIGGMKGNPIHVGALRYVPDQAIPPSDCQMSRFQVDEISKGRTQMIRQRERSIPMRVADLQGIGGEEGLAKLEKNLWQAVIPLENMDPQHPPIVEIARAQFPRENFTFDQVANHDVGETWALDSNQRGTLAETERTATELQIAQNNSNVRMDAERTKFLEWFVAGVSKLGALIQMFATDTSYVAIAGDDGAKRLQAWNKHDIQGEFVYTAKPNSAIRIDAATERQQIIQLYNLLAPNPFINQQELITSVVRKFDLDPSKLVVQPQPKPAELPKISYSFTGVDLNPISPAFPIVLEILRQGGVQLNDSAIMAAQKQAMLTTGQPPADAVPHGNSQAPPPSGSQMPMPHGGPVNKHQQERTGQRTGPPIGGMAA